MSKVERELVAIFALAAGVAAGLRVAAPIASCVVTFFDETGLDADALNVVELAGALVGAFVELALLVVALDDITLGVAVLFITSLCEASLDVAAIEI